MSGEKLIVADYGTLQPELGDVLLKFAAEGYQILDAESFGAEAVRQPDLTLSSTGLNPAPRLAEELIRIKAEGVSSWIDALTNGRLTGAFAQNIQQMAERQVRKESVNVGDDGFRVYLPLTGGMDSTTLYTMAQESGYPTEPLYLDMGQPYSELEIGIADKLATKYGQDLEVIHLPLDFKNFGEIMLGRNAAIIFSLAERMRQRGEWGELWFGNLAGESPVTGGDKSRRFFNDVQALLGLLNYDMRVTNPLIGMDKPDEVAYMKDRDIDDLIRTKSCFDPGVLQCGNCAACFRKWVAFTVHDIDIGPLCPEGTDIREAVRSEAIAYRKNMTRASQERDYSHYSPSRIRTTLAAIATLAIEEP